MTNLTGQYDVIGEVGVDLLNAILGAVHENQNTSYPTMPHSMNLFVDDSYRGAADPVSESERTGVRSRIEVQVSTPTISLPVETLVVRPNPELLEGARLAREAPAAHPYASSLPRIGAIGGDVEDFALPPVFTPFSYPKVATQARVRAWTRDTPDLPDFIDGDLVVTSGLVRSDVPGVGTFLTVDRTFGPTVTFRAAADTGATDEQQQRVAAIVRNFIRSDMDPATFRVSLPPAVRYFDYKLQPEARRPSILLLLTLTSGAPDPGASEAITGGLLPDGADFVVAVGRDYVVGTLRSQLFQGLSDSYSYSKLGVSATVRPDWAGASFDLEPGRIVFSLTGDGDISWWGIDDHFTFSVRQAFGLQIVDGGLAPFADGDPEVHLDDVAVGGDYLEGRARDTIRAERDAGLAAGVGQLRHALDVRGQLDRILGGINPAPPGVTLSGVEIRPDGLLVPGNVSLAASGPVVVGEVVRAGFDDALECWIPGGTVERYRWERFPSFPPDVRVDEHRFVTEAMTGGPLGGFCLTVEGTRVTPGGNVAPVSATTCVRFSPIFTQVTGLSATSSRPLLPLTEPGPRGGIQVVGHYDPWAPGRVPAGGHANLLVYFGAEGSEDEAAVLRGALEGAKKRDAAILAVSVVPAGTLPAAVGAGAHSHVVTTDDPDGSWAAAFGVSEAPAAVLVSRQGEIVWRGPGLTAAKLARALDRYAEPGGEVARLPIRLPVRLNERPPDLPIRLPDGRELSLRRLKGRPVALAFCSPRSGPSLEHLGLLREVAAARGQRAPLIIAVFDGGDPDHATELLGGKGIAFLVLADPERRISSRYGVWCWPVTVWIRPDQRVEAIDIGTAATRGSPFASIRG